MPLHSDNETCISPKSWIIIISIGANKTLYFEDCANNKKFEVLVNHGDILAMSTSSQSRIKHKVLSRIAGDSNFPRASLTFRQIILNICSYRHLEPLISTEL